MKILGISGSLREKSSNTALLNILKSISNSEIDIYKDIGKFPFFSPELDDGNTPEIVKEFRAILKNSDAVVISTPEYAFGIPGVLKNALDWTVSSGEFSKKPVAAISASPTINGGDKAHAGLLLVLKAQGAHIVWAASQSIPMIYKKISKNGEIIDKAIEEVMKNILTEIRQSIKERETAEK
jgi:chromate reductase, NAD(P)H dehydrogenase (quinone)